MTKESSQKTKPTPEMLDRTLIAVAMQHSMQYPVERTASASVFAVPPGLDTDILKAQGALASAASRDELESHIRNGEKAVFIPKESSLRLAMIVRVLEELHADVAVFMEVETAPSSAA